MANLNHKDLTNHPTDPQQHNLHKPGATVANAAALAAVTTMQQGDWILQLDINIWFQYDGAAWRPTLVSSNVLTANMTIPSNTSWDVVDHLTINAGVMLTIQAGAYLQIS